MLSLTMTKAQAKDLGSAQNCILSIKQVEQIHTVYRSSDWAQGDDRNHLINIQKNLDGQIINLTVFDEKNLSESRVDDRSQ